MHSVFACGKWPLRDWIWYSTVQKMMGERNTGRKSGLFCKGLERFHHLLFHP